MKRNNFSLDGKTAFITGSGRGLGFIFARGLAEAGARVIINDFYKDRADKAADSLKAEGYSCSTCSFDITNSEETKTSIKKMISQEKHIDILVNNAGIQKRYPVQSFPYEEWRQILDVNLLSQFHVSQQVAHNMIDLGKGKIVNICSLTSEAARKTISAYTVSKGGMKSLTKALAVELGPYNIQVNGIGPGYIATEMNTSLAEDPAFDAWVKNRSPSGRWGTPEDLLGTLIFLCSEASDYVNGQIIYIDGGFLANLGGP